MVVHVAPDPGPPSARTRPAIGLRWLPAAEARSVRPPAHRYRYLLIAGLAEAPSTWPSAFGGITRRGARSRGHRGRHRSARDRDRVSLAVRSAERRARASACRGRPGTRHGLDLVEADRRCRALELVGVGLSWSRMGGAWTSVPDLPSLRCLPIVTGRIASTRALLPTPPRSARVGSGRPTGSRWAGGEAGARVSAIGGDRAVTAAPDRPAARRRPSRRHRGVCAANAAGRSGRVIATLPNRLRVRSAVLGRAAPAVGARSASGTSVVT